MYLADKRTLAGIAAAGQATYLHGLGKTPDGVQISFISAVATSTNIPLICTLIDSTAVTMSNCGSATSPTIQAITYVLHALVN